MTVSFGHLGLNAVNLYSLKKEIFSKFKYTDCKFIYKDVSNEDSIDEISSRYCANISKKSKELKNC